jgi:WD40 repeat protein
VTSVTRQGAGRLGLSGKDFGSGKKNRVFDDILTGSDFFTGYGSPNGRFLAASSDNGSVALWNVADPGRPVLVDSFTASSGDWVTGEAYSPDGRTLATSNRPEIIWRVLSPKQKALG